MGKGIWRSGSVRSATRCPFRVMSFHYPVAIGNLATVAALDEGVEAWRATVPLPPYANVTVTNWAGRVATRRAGATRPARTNSA